MNRRKLLSMLAALGVAAQARHVLGDQSPSTIEPLVLSDEEWKKRLSPEQYAVLREEATERPGSSPLNHEKRKGTFLCAGCALPLFGSDMKYESGTGWPSF